MRQGEIFRLRWEYVNPKKGWLDVSRVELSEIALAALRWHSEHFPSTSGLVFTTDGKSPIWKRSFVQRVLDPLLEVAGVRRVVFHELRHTVNSLLWRRE